MNKQIQRAWDSVSMYLPVLLMGLLALGSWWLVRNAPVPPQAQAAPVLRHEPDYFMRDFAVKTFDGSGRLQSTVQGAQVRHYPDTDTLEIDQPRLRSVSPEGRIIIASAQRAITNSDGSEVQLFGNAIVTREAQQQSNGQWLPRLQFEGEFLHAWPKQERVHSHVPVTLVRGNDRFMADTLNYDHTERVLSLQGQVRGTVQPPDPIKKH